MFYAQFRSRGAAARTLYARYTPVADSAIDRRRGAEVRERECECAAPFFARAMSRRVCLRLPAPPSRGIVLPPPMRFIERCAKRDAQSAQERHERYAAMTPTATPHERKAERDDRARRRARTC